MISTFRTINDLTFFIFLPIILLNLITCLEYFNTKLRSGVQQSQSGVDNSIDPRYTNEFYFKI